MPTKKKTVAQDKLTNHIVFVVDRSGSMQSVRTPAQNAIASNLKTIKSKAKETNQKTTISYVRFDTVIDIEFLRKQVEDAPDKLTIEPRGGTALMDATGVAVEELLKFKDAADKNTSFLVVVITDGEENASRTFTADTLAKLMAKVQGTDRWTFAFLVPNESARQNLSYRFGVPVDNIRVWEQTTRGAEEMGEAVSQGIGGYYAVRSAGMTSSKSFFSPDMSKVKKSDLKKLDDIQKRVQIWTVPSETPIQPFVEAKLGWYHPGNGFYQLMKKEKVQFHKAIAIVDKGSGAVYSGPDARDVLGLPNSDATVVPGNHGNYDIFIQSTSNNRKLPRGTKLLYIKK